MLIFPAIDLKDGQVVRLAEGDMDRATIYGDDPAAQAALFAEQGAEVLHVVDLDGSFAGDSRNGEAVAAIVARFPGHVQLGGGIRSRAQAERWFELGVARLVLGTAALTDPALVKALAADFPGGVVVAADARDAMIATVGWGEQSDVEVVDLARRFEDAGVAAILFTDIGRDGMLSGINIARHRQAGSGADDPDHRPRAACRRSTTSSGCAPSKDVGDRWRDAVDPRHLQRRSSISP